MSIIYSYPEQGALNANDMLIGTSTEKVGGKQKNITRNFTIQQIADFINRGAGFVDPAASDFQIPVFNQEGKKITGSIISQNIYPNGSAITITGSLTTTGAISTVSDLTASGVVNLGSQANLISLNSKTRLNGPILDVAGNTGLSNQILISNGTGNVYWQNYEAGLTYEGTWNASTNTPTLTSGQGVSGHFYIVNVAGNTNLDGNNDWHVGDWAVFFDAGGAGTAGWQKIDNTSVLTGSGTANTFAMWTATETLNDSLLSQDAGATKVIVDGLLEIKGDGTSQDGRIKLNCWNNNHGVTIQSPPHSAAQSWTWILPQTTGGANDVLTTDGNTPSQLSWTTPTAPVTGTGTENYVTKWSTGGTGIEDSTIFDNGTNVGIGTTSPSTKLEVNGEALVGSGTDGIKLTYSSGNSTGIINTGYSSTGLEFRTSNVERMRITSEGNVEIKGKNSGAGNTQMKLIFDNSDVTVQANQLMGGIQFKSADGSGSGAGIKSSINTYFTGNDGYNDMVFSTAGNDANNVERMRITSAGNVGIGTNSPGSLLSIRTASSSGNEDFVTFSRGTSPETEVLKISRNAGDVRFLAEQNITLSADYNNDQGNVRSNIILKTNDVEAMRIDGNGKVGIGTSSPAVSLDISATDAVQMPAGVTGDRPTGANGMLRYNSSNNGFEGFINGNWGAIGGGSSGGLIFRGTFNASTGAIAGGGNLTSGANRVAIAIGDMYIVDTAGDFYGDTSKPLNVGDEVICVLDAAVGTSDINDWNAIASGSGGAVTGSGTTNYVPKFTGATVVGNSSIFNDASGNVGIGTTSPAVELDVRGEISVGHNATYGLRFYNQARSNWSSIGNFATDNTANLNFRTGAGVTMTMSNGGNVGIGTTSPAAKLHVHEAASGQSSPNAAADTLVLEGSSSAGISILNTNAGVGSIFFGDNNDNFVGGFRYDHSDNSLDINVNNVRAIAIDSSRNVGIGTATPSVSLDLGSKNDAVSLPAGDDAARPSTPVPGMIRYNASASEFEGYSGILNVSGSWGSLGGGLPTKTVDAFTGSGQGSISLSVEASDKNYIDMYIDGVYQSKATYSIATVGAISVLTLNSAGTFPTGVSIETVTTT